MIKVVLVDSIKATNRLTTLVDWNSLNYEISAVVNNGSDALDMVRMFNPDLIITDINLPDMNGTDMILQAQKIKYNIKFIITSENHDFNSMRFAIKSNVIDYLLKPVKKAELMQTIISFSNIYALKAQRYSHQQLLRQRNRNDIDRLRKCFFEDVIFPKEYIGTSDISKLNSIYYLNMDAGEFCSFIIKIDGQAANSIYSKLIETVNDMVSINCNEAVFYRKNSHIIFAVNYPHGEYDTIKNNLYSCIAKFNEESFLPKDISITIGLGGSSGNIIGLRYSYNYAFETVKQRVIVGCRKVIDTVPLYDHFNFNSISSQFGKSISESVDLLDMDATILLLDKIKEYFDCYCETGTSYYRAVCLIFILFLIQINTNYDINADLIALLTDTQKNILSCGTSEQMFDTVKNVLNTLFSSIISRSKKTDTLPIRIAKKYILDNYMHPISLEEVSKEVGFNPSYFSTMFKQECGIGFSEYLSNVRINRAMALLRETNLHVSEVCNNVGYTDLKHFTKIFKKKTSVSPTEFRKKHM